MKRYIVPAVAFLAAFAIVPRAQMRVAPVDEDQGHVALALALRHLENAGIFMMATAHPDDEDNGLFVMLNRGQGYRTTLATATRGNGGQNEIGPELFEELGVLRTEELAALHRFDGAEQYFTRAVDFGYSFSLDETLEKWGRDEITADFVRLVRMIRPDVVTAMTPNATGGGLHHSASAMLSHDAYKFAADATKYPEQLKDGLRPWQAKKFYYRAGFGGNPPSTAGRLTRCDLAVFDSTLGKTYSEIGTEARSMHKCQGQAQLLALPGPATSSYQLAESTIPGAMDKDEKTLFDGIDTSLVGLAKFAGARPPKELLDGLTAIASALQAAQKQFDGVSDAATLQPLLAGLHAVRVLRGQLPAIAIDNAARFEVDFRLRQKEREFQQAILTANSVYVDALADDGVVVPGQPVKVSVIVASHGGADVNVKQVKFDGFDGNAACVFTTVTGSGGGPGGGGGRGAAPPAGPVISTFKKEQAGRCDQTLKIPASERISEPYWHREGEAGGYTFDADAPFGLPFRPTPFSVQVTLAFPGGEEVIATLPVQYRYEGNIFSGEKRMDLLVVPAFAVRVSPDVAIIPVASVRSTGAASGRGRPADTSGPASAVASREIRVTVINDTQGATNSVVRLKLPQGWTATPAEQPLMFSRADESQTVRFQIRPAPNTAPGEFHVRALVSRAASEAGGPGSQTFDRGFQVIEYPHIRRRHIYQDADTTVKVIDVKTAPNLVVGYVMGVGDQVPPAIQQLGAKLEMIGGEDLQWGDLSRFDAIVTGVRAYERRDDLRANNSRLLAYVRNGGTLIVQYNKFEFNQAQYGPYPAQVGAFAGSGIRVTDENAPVGIADPDSHVLHLPNEITDAAWRGWKQERGLYFLGEKDPRYHDLVELADPFPNNPGTKRGALVETTYGKGHWIYVGLNLWRQLPAGVDGAYQILANLISLGARASPARAPARTPSAVPAR